MRKLVLILFIYCYCLHLVKCYFVELSNDGPVVSGATIDFEAKLFDNYRQKITTDSSFSFHWRDDAIPPHTGVTKGSDISHWSTSYKKPGRYEVEVTVHVWPAIFDFPITSARQFFNVTLMLNGDMTIMQDNNTIELSTPYASSAAPVTHEVTLSKPDADYLKTNATSVLSYWFVDCVYYGVSDELRFDMNYTGQAGTDKHIETIVIASYVEPTPPPPTTTTSTTTPSSPPPTSSTTTTTTSKPPITTQTPPNSTDPSSNITKPVSSIPIDLQTNEVSETTLTPTNSTTLPINNNTTNNSSDVTPPQFVPDLLKNVTLIVGKNYSNSPDLPYICVNSSTIPPSGKETYGYFKRKIGIRDPVQNVSFTGTNWLKQGDMLNLGVSCNGSAPFFKCVKMYPGDYNITGNETCDNTRVLMDCKFAIIHYFKTAKTYKLAIIISNEVSKIVTPVAVNIYEVTKHPQLSVIIVPVAFSTIAVILIVFGIAYYIQSRNKYTVEVADFDFAQTSDMEYKTFSERLKDAMSNAINRTQDYVEEGNVWSPSRKYGSMQ